MKKYENEVRERWGKTAAFVEHAKKTKHYTKEKWAEVNETLMSIFAAFSACRESGAAPCSAEAQALAAELQAHITESFYTCTDEILAGLGKMYTADERFVKTIDQYGDGTAAFVSAAIGAYCNGRNKNENAVQ